MIIRVKNIQYFDWEVPEELIDSAAGNDDNIFQNLIDEHFDPDNISVNQVSDDYYEFEEVL